MPSIHSSKKKAQRHPRIEGSKLARSIRRLKTTAVPAKTMNTVLEWLEQQCPNDVLPKILSFAGPHSLQALNLTSRYWHSVVDEEATWKVLCEELHKWKDGDALPSSWKEYYRLTPCIPVDYPTLNSTGLATLFHHPQAETTDPRAQDEQQHIRILIKPGKYIMTAPITVRTTMRVTVETLEMPITKEHDVGQEQVKGSSSKRKLLRRAGSFRKSVMLCRAVNIVNDEPSNPSEEADDTLRPDPTRAMLVFQSSQHNEPVFRVRQGTVTLNNMTLVHSSQGIDIWNGNAAIQVQPPLRSDDDPQPVPRPTAILNRMKISSRSGRGVVAIDGGLAQIYGCYVHDCAATGIYVGGPGSSAIIERTDVLRNGNGNHSRRGIARGHSGVYLEQGTAVVRDCNISENSLTGLSAISRDNAVLSLEQSDLVSNGTNQLEMPPDGSISRRRSRTLNNQVSAHGLSRERSGLMGAA